ncbi:AraC family transcriptional regulator [Ekhidna sp.]
MSSLPSIPLFESIDEYNLKIGIDAPRYQDFDIRDFEENMKTVKLKMPAFRIPFFQIALVESGTGEVTADGNKYDLDKFTLFFNQPNQILYWNVSDDWKGYYINIDESFYTVRIDGYSQLFDFPFFKKYRSGIHLGREEAEMMLEIMAKINDEYTNPTPYNLPIIKSLLSTVLSYSIRFHERAYHDEEERKTSDNLSARFKDAVHNHLNELVLNLATESKSVGIFSDELSVTPSHLSETIKKELGQTPTDYINERLVKESQKLLRSTDLQIKELAYLLKFKDTSYFGRVFRKISGLTPAQYRNQHG